MFEVKALSGEPSGLAEFEMGESEVRAAQAASRGDRYRILLVTAALDPEDRRIQVLPNPFSARGQGFSVSPVVASATSARWAESGRRGEDDT